MTAAEKSAPSGCPVVTFDPYDPTLTHPAVWPAYEDLRDAGAVCRSDSHGGFHLMGRFDDIRAALRDPITFSSASGHRIPTDGSQKSVPIDFDPPLHTAYRRLLTHALDPARVRALQPFLRATIERLVDDFIAAGGGDFVNAVALPLPLQVLVEVVGFSPDTVGRFRRITEDLWGDMTAMTFTEAAAAIYALMAEEIADHRERRPDDFVTWLLSAEVDGRPLRDDEMAGSLASLAVAGHETTMNAASTMVHLLAERPTLQEALREAPERAPDFVEEMLRLRSPAQNFARRTTRDVEVDGHVIPEGSGVLLSYAAGNRDDRHFPSPDEFDIDRASRGHLAFGWGIHQCVGAALARSELRLLAETLAARAPFTLDGEVVYSSLQGGNHLGPTYLPIRFTNH
ncbi:cytochrome P450 [Jatrophihabitans sp. YIM 134969]